MEISEAELEAAIADTAGMPDPVIREALLNLIEKGLVVDSGMRRNGQWQCVSPRPW
jgi:DNA-binding GntR family transcriptional regulator